MAKNKCALVLLVDEKWHISYHPTPKDAEAASKRQANYSLGWVVSGPSDLVDDMPISRLELLLNYLMKKKPGTHKVAYLLEGRDQVWAELRKSLPGAPADAPAPPPEDEVVEDEPAAEEVTTEEEAGEETPSEEGETAAEGEGDNEAETPPGAPAKPQSETKMPTAQSQTRTVSRGAVVKKGAKKATKITTAKAPAAAKVSSKTAAAGGPRTLNPAWVKIFVAINKKGADGMEVADMAEECKKNKVGLYYRRFEKAGLLARVARGKYKLTAAGAKAAGVTSSVK